MATKKPAISFEALMNLLEDDFIDFCERNGYMAELNEIASRDTEQKVYPKVLKPMKKPTPAQVKKNPACLEAYKKGMEEGKMTWQADKTQKPRIVLKPITFFEVKAAFATEVLKLEKKAPVEVKDTFRGRIAKRAQNA